MPRTAHATYMRDLPVGMATPINGSSAPLAAKVVPLARSYPMAHARRSSKAGLPMGVAYPLVMAKPKRKRSAPSSCVRRPRGNCSSPCSWAAGKKRSYCAISRKKTSGAASPKKTKKSKKAPPPQPVYYQDVEEI